MDCLYVCTCVLCVDPVFDGRGRARGAKRKSGNSGMTTRELTQRPWPGLELIGDVISKNNGRWNEAASSVTLRNTSVLLGNYLTLASAPFIAIY